MHGGAAQEVGTALEIDGQLRRQGQHWKLAVRERESVPVVFADTTVSSHLEIHFPLTVLLNEGGT